MGTIARIISHLVASNCQFETILNQEREKMNLFAEQEYGKRTEQPSVLTVHQKQEQKNMIEDQAPTDDKYESEMPEQSPSKKPIN